MFKKNKLAATVFSVVMSFPVASYSEQLEEIIVTATKRAERLQDIPISMTTISGNKIQSAGIERIEDLSVYVPNFTLAETGISTNIYIRGIGSGINQGFEQSVGMYVDGIYFGRAQLTRAPFLDLERVEVLRGPQSIVLGKNSVAGAINVTTAKPTSDFEVEVSHLYEPELNENKSRIIVNAPFSDTVRGRLAAQVRKIDNHIENITEGSKDPGREEDTVRATLAWDMTENLTATLKAERGNFDVTGRNVEIIDDIASEKNQDSGVIFPLFPSPPGTQGLTFVNILNRLGVQSSDIENVTLDGKRSSNGDFSNNTTDNLTLTFEYDIGGYTLTSVTGIMGYEFDEKCDCDFTGADILELYSDEEFDQRSQEFRLLSPKGENFDFLAGVYYQTNEVDFNESLQVSENSVLRNLLNLPFPIPGNIGDQVVSKSVDRVYRSDTDSISAFAQGTFHLSNTVDLTLGLRYSKEEKDGFRSLTFNSLDGTPLVEGSPAHTFTSFNYALIFGVAEHEHEGKREEEHWLPSIELEWKITDNAMVYASYKEGSKAGGFDARSNSPVGPRTPADGFPFLVAEGTFEYEDEEASSIELGAKMAFFDNQMELNVAAYETDYKNLQVSIFDGEVGFNVGNAGGATARGVELDGRWLATNNLLMSYSLAYSEFEFNDFENGQCYLGQEPDIPKDVGARQPDLCIYNGKSNQYVAPVTAALVTQYHHEIGANLMFKGALDIIYNDEFLLSQNLDPSVSQDSFYKFNGSLAISDIDNTWEVALIAKNITDETTLSYANEAPVAAGTFYVGSHYAFVQPPRTVAIQGTYRF